MLAKILHNRIYSKGVQKFGVELRVFYTTSQKHWMQNREGYYKKSNWITQYKSMKHELSYNDKFNLNFLCIAMYIFYITTVSNSVFIHT